MRQGGLSGDEKPTECLQISRTHLFLEEEEPTAPLDGEAQIPYAVFQWRLLPYEASRRAVSLLSLRVDFAILDLRYLTEGKSSKDWTLAKLAQIAAVDPQETFAFTN